MNQSTIGTYETMEAAEHAVRTLDKGGFPIRQVSIITQDLKDERKVQGYITTGDVAKQGASVGAWTGGLFGLLMGAAFIWVPGFGPLLVAGAFATVLLGSIEGAAVGAVSGSVLGALFGWGVSKQHILKYEEQLKAGKYLIIAHGSDAEVGQAHALLTQTQVSELVHTEMAEDEHTWAKLIAPLEAALTGLDTEIAKESHTLHTELTTLWDTRDAKRQELELHIQARIDSLNKTITQGRLALTDSSSKAKANATAEIATLEAKRNTAWQQLEASWHSQQAAWQRDLEALQVWAAKATAAAKASIDTQIVALEAKRQASQKKWDQRRHAAADAAQDLKTGAGVARVDLQQARAKAAAEFK